MTNPTNKALLGHRWGVYLRSHDGLYEEWIDRVQNVEPTSNIPTTKFYEIGNLDPTGVEQQPADMRWTMMENLHNCESDAILAGKDPDGASIQFTAGDMVTNSGSIRACLVSRNEGGTNTAREYVFDQLALTEVQYRFVIGGACEVSYTLEGTAGKVLTSSYVHSSWGTLDTTSPGGINGKDARVFFSGSAAGNRAYRLQSFTIRAAFPVQTVKELGNRTTVGKLVDVPDITVDMDFLNADEQPDDIFFNTTSGGYDYNSSKLVSECFIYVYDPSLTEAATVLKGFKVENLRMTTASPARAQVRGMATKRYTATVEKATTASSSGLLIRNGDFD